MSPLSPASRRTVAKPTKSLVSHIVEPKSTTVRVDKPVVKAQRTPAIPLTIRSLTDLSDVAHESLRAALAHFQEHRKSHPNDVEGLQEIARALNAIVADRPKQLTVNLDS